MTIINSFEFNIKQCLYFHLLLEWYIYLHTFNCLLLKKHELWFEKLNTKKVTKYITLCIKTCVWGICPILVYECLLRCLKAGIERKVHLTFPNSDLENTYFFSILLLAFSYYFYCVIVNWQGLPFLCLDSTWALQL